MADPFTAEIRIYPFSFAPRNWAFCNGQLLQISQNTALFSLLGTTYGGDGKFTFALPDMQGNAPMMWGQSPGLSLHDLGETGGSETVSLLESEIPSHQHIFKPSIQPADNLNPQGLALGTGNRQYTQVASPPAGTTAVNLSDVALAPIGGDQPHNNMQPYLTLNFCIALAGVFPPRS